MNSHPISVIILILLFVTVSNETTFSSPDVTELKTSSAFIDHNTSPEVTEQITSSEFINHNTSPEVTEPTTSIITSPEATEPRTSSSTIIIDTTIPISTTEVAKSHCDPPTDADCADSKTFGVADPLDCHSFYICTNGTISGIPYKCANGYYFDTNAGSCQPESIPCTDECVIKYECAAPVCNIGTLSVYPDPDNCTIYYICDTDGTTLTDTCYEPTPYFNGEGCSDDESQCCTTTQCDPYCGEDITPYNTNVADPCDCHSFYLCESIDSIPTIHATCPNNGIYNVTDCGIPGDCEPSCSVDQCTII